MVLLLWMFFFSSDFSCGFSRIEIKIKVKKKYIKTKRTHYNYSGLIISYKLCAHNACSGFIRNMWMWTPPQYPCHSLAAHTHVIENNLFSLDSLDIFGLSSCTVLVVFYLTLIENHVIVNLRMRLEPTKKRIFNWIFHDAFSKRLKLTISSKCELVIFDEIKSVCVTSSCGLHRTFHFFANDIDSGWCACVCVYFLLRLRTFKQPNVE